MQRYTIEINGNSYVVEVDESGVGTYRVIVDGAEFAVRLAKGAEIRTNDFPPQIVTEVASTHGPKDPGVRPKVMTEIRAPMPGVVLSVDVQPGDSVRIAQQLIVLEAMKMKIPISSPRDGVVAEVVVREAESVGHGDMLLRFEEA